MKVVTAAQMREIDRVTIEERGVPGLTLMERAGRAVAREAAERFQPDSVVVLAGSGNNGGDGFVAARSLQQSGIPCSVFLFADTGKLKGDALSACEAMPEAVRREIRPSADGLAEELLHYDLIIDALLGTGSRGPVTGLFAEVIDAANSSRIPILAVDIPSGLPPDGQPLDGPCVRAAVTVTMGLPKLGMLLHPGVQRTGTIVTADLNFPDDLLTSPAIPLNVLGPPDVGRMLPVRPPDGNKGTFGKLQVLAGSIGMSGAAILTSKAACRSGVGLVYAGAVEALMPAFDLHLIESVKLPIPSASKSHFDSTSIEAALHHAETVDAVALGPGIGTAEGTAEFVHAIVKSCLKPLVIDADGLNAFSQDLSVLKQRPAPTILTPHPGEMSRLCETSIEAIQKDRIAAAIYLATEHGVVVLLKGAQSIIARPDGQAFINTSGNTGLAKGGSGDVLTGLVAGLLAQGMEAWQAAVAGAFLHGLAADLTAEKIGVRAMTPSDLLDFFGEAFKTLEKAAR